MSHSPLIDRRHLDFMLHDLLGVERLSRYPRFADHGRDVFDATLDLAHRIADVRLGDLAESADLLEGVLEFFGEKGKHGRDV